MLTNNPDAEWQKFGENDPYYWVTTIEKYRDKEFSRDRRSEFFEESGNYVRKLFGIIRRHLDPSFSPGRTLDFGCGVGRVAIPLAEKAEEVVGVDVSDSMLDEARKNRADNNLANLDFYKADDRLSALDGTFGFIHSIYVFQHIPFSRGKTTLRRMLEMLDDDGVLSLQFLISNDLSRLKRLSYWMRLNIPLFKNIHNLLSRKKWNEPLMQLNTVRRTVK